MVIFPLNNKKAPAVPAGTNWQDYSGKADTPLIGVMVPDGVVVLDIDSHKGCTTDQVDAALGVKLPWGLAELQTTMNGGKHYVFVVDDDIDLPNGQNLLGVNGFDTRVSFKGYIATGKGYTNLTMHSSVQDALHDKLFWPKLPKEVCLKLAGSRGAVALTSDEDLADLVSMVRDHPLELSQHEVEVYVSKLPDSAAEEGDKWLRVGMGIYHQSEGAEWGWELFDAFSQRCSDKYDRDNNRKRWESFGKHRDHISKPVTFASVIEMAGGSWLIEADRLEQLKERIVECDDTNKLNKVISEIATMKLDELNTAIITKALQKQFTQVVGEKITEVQVRRIIKRSKPAGAADFYQDYVYLTSTALYMERETKTTMNQRAFDVKHDRDTPRDMDGNPQRASVYVNDKIECVHSGMYAPMFDDIFIYDGVEYFNTYKPNRVERRKAGTTNIIERIKKHIAHLLPNEDEQQLLMNYLAHNVQFPGKKMQWAIILQGVQGDGKSFFAEMMKHVLGPTNCRTITVESIDEKFTSWAEGNCMTFIEELKLDNYRKYDILNKLKMYIANPTVSVRRMQQDVYEAINTTNYFGLTNFKDALPIDNNDRRYCILFSQWQSKTELELWLQDNPNYYSDLYDDMRNSIGEIVDWMMSHPIPDSFKALNRAPNTLAKGAMQELNRGEDFLLVEDAIEEFKCHDINDFVVNITKLHRLATDGFNPNYRDFPKTSRLKNILSDLGYSNIGRIKDDSRMNFTIYCKDHTKKPADFKK